MSGTIFSLKLLSLGLFVGFISGLFGKGGSAVATPLLQLIGVSAFSAVASPLPATIPGTMVASLAYFRAGFYDKKTVLWSIAVGLPATIIGAWLSQYVAGKSLLLVSNLILIALGISFLVGAKKHSGVTGGETTLVSKNNLVLVAVAAAVGLISGMLANSGGFLLAPLYNKLLKLPLKMAFACSLLVSAALAVPGTLVHFYLGHIDWSVVLIFGLGSVPFSYVGARTAIRTPVKTLEPLFGLMLVVIGLWGAADIFR